MKQCEVIVNIEVGDIHIIKSKLNKKDTIFFTNDLAIFNKGKKLGLNIEISATYFGFFNPKYDSINEISINRLNILENYLNDGTLERKSVILGFRYINLINFINLEKIKKILELKENVVFLFKNFAFYFPAILDTAHMMGFKSKGEILTVSNSKIISFEMNNRYDKLEKLKDRLKKRIQEYENDSFAHRLSKVKFKQQNFDVGFFLINNDTDFYLKPIYPILRESIKRKLNVKSFTFDERTTNQVYEQKFSGTNLSKYFFDAYFPYSASIMEQLKYLFKEQKLLAIHIFYHTYLQKYQFFRNTVSKLKNKSKLKKFNIIPQILLGIIVAFYLMAIHMKHKYILAKWAMLRFYVRNLEQHQFIRKIITKPKVKSLLLKDLTGLDDSLDFKIHGVPEIEIKKLLNFINKTKAIKSEDILLKNYLKCFNDNYIVGWILQFLVIHSLINTIFKKMQFKSLIIAADSTPFNNVVCNIAKSKNIPTFSIPQVYIKFPKIFIVLSSASKIFVSGERVKNEFITLGMNKERIIVTGNPRYDYIKKNLNAKQLDKKSSRKLIVVAMSRWHEKDPQWISQLIQFCNKNSFDVLIKIHPMYKFHTNNEFSEELVKEIKKNCSGLKFSISYDIDLMEILPKTDILVTEYSIVAIEAAFNEVPVIVTNIHRDKDDEYSKSYQNEGIAIHTSNISELCDSIEKIFNDKDTKLRLMNAIKKFNYNYNYLHDGNSAKRICKILTEIKSDKISIKN